MNSKNTRTKTSKSSNEKSSTKKEVSNIQTVNEIVENKLEGGVVEVGKKDNKKTKSLEPTKKVDQVVEVKEIAVKEVPVKSEKAGKKVLKNLNEKQTKVLSKVEKKVENKVENVIDKKTKNKKIVNEATEELMDTMEAGDGDDDMKGGKLRYFKLIYNNEIQGRYCGKKPKQAANKAFSSIVKDLKKSGQKGGGVNMDINFTIRECTRNSKHKEYKYIGKRHVLENPVKVEIANPDGSIKQIEYKFHNKLQKAPKQVV